MYVLSTFKYTKSILTLFPYNIEGDKNVTASRRGQGVYDILMSAMNDLHERKLIFGVSITVTNGGAEPCPFSPYSDVNVRDTIITRSNEIKAFYNIKRRRLS